MHPCPESTECRLRSPITFGVLSTFAVALITCSCLAASGENADTSSKPAPELQRLEKLKEQATALIEEMKSPSRTRPLDELRNEYLTTIREMTELSNQDRARRQADLDAQVSSRKNRSLVVGGTTSMSLLLDRWYATFLSGQAGKALPKRLYFESARANGQIRAFLKGEYQLLVLDRALTETELQSISDAQTELNTKIEVHEVGRMALGIAVHKTNLIRSLTVSEVESLFRTEADNWSDVGHFDRPVERYGTTSARFSYSMFNHEILDGKRVLFPDERRRKGLTTAERQARDERAAVLERINRFPGHGPFPRFPSDQMVIDEVGRRHNAIGYCLVPMGDIDSLDVRFVPIARAPADAIAPTREDILLGRYPLTRTVRILVHPQAKPIAREFVYHICSVDGAKSVRAAGMLAAVDRIPLLREERIEQFKAGKGPRLKIAGDKSLRALADTMLRKFVEHDSVAQLQFTSTNRSLQPAAFAKINSDLAIIDDWQTVDTWLQNDDGQSQTANLVGFRTVAIIVHPDSKLGSLTVPEVAKLFKMPRYQGSALATDDKQHWYGLFAARATAESFYRQVVPELRRTQLSFSDDHASAIGKVSIDRRGIALVDYSAILRWRAENRGATQSFKVIGIKTDGGVVHPSPATLRNRTYPISSPVAICVSPKAIREARALNDFFRSSEAHAVLLDQGLVPEIESPAGDTNKPD